MELPNFALALAYWLHIIATVMWVGGMITLSWLVIPAARRTLEAGSYADFLERLQDGLQRIGWLSLVVLVATGMFQMSAHPAYEGFLTISNSWSVAILAKHLVIGLMVMVSAYLTWGLMPALRRLSFKRSAGLPIDEAENQALARREATMLRVNLILSVVVLLLTAVARAA